MTEPTDRTDLCVLVIDDEESLRHLLRMILERSGYRVIEATDGQDGVAKLDAHPEARVVMCDIRMPNMDGLTFLDAVAGRDLRVVMMSAYGTTDTAMECLRRGACDYITKPFRIDEIRICLERITEREQLLDENRTLRQQIQSGHTLAGFIGRSPAAAEVMAVVRKVAAYPTTVLFTGESGTGKELMAHALHSLSPRAQKPFVPINCAALPESLLESELFGHERGSFTGAHRSRAGLFEQADGGTLLLDEIGDMPLTLQTRLLRVLEDGRVRRIGGDRDIAVDVRVVAATAADLDASVADGRFRSDLFYRLNVVRVRLPPLRKRREDIPMLTAALIHRAAERLGRRVVGTTDEAMRALVAGSWPGNVRQLENALEHGVLMARGELIALSELPPIPAEVAAPEPVTTDDLSIKRRTAQLERSLIVAALQRTDGNRSQAAKLLEISYKTLVYKIRDYELED